MHVKWTSTLIPMCENNHGSLCPKSPLLFKWCIIFPVLMSKVLFLYGFAQFSIGLEFGREKNTTFLPQHPHWSIKKVQIILLLGSREREIESCIGSELTTHYVFLAILSLQVWTSIYYPLCFFLVILSLQVWTSS